MYNDHKFVNRTDCEKNLESPCFYLDKLKSKFLKENINIYIKVSA